YNSPNHKILKAGNPQLQNLNALSALANIGGNLTIADNDVLEHINGLSALATIGTTGNSNTGNIYIGGNAELLSCNGLSSLTEIKGHLTLGSDDRYYYINSSNYFLDSGGNTQLQN